MSRSRHGIVLAAALAALAGCADSRGASADQAATRDRQPASSQVRRSTGLTHLPVPESFAALDRSLARHYPPELRGVRPRTAVLVDVKLDRRGIVRDVVAVDPPSANASFVAVETVPGSSRPVEREYHPVYDRAFGPAAQAAVKEVRFRPAIRAGKPVSYTLRMTVEFTSPN